jgi:hypothetical protein
MLTAVETRLPGCALRQGGGWMRFLFLGGALGIVVALLLRNRDAVRGMLDQTPLKRSRTSNLEDMTKDELYECAQKADIPGRSETTKSELIKALRFTS